MSGIELEISNCCKKEDVQKYLEAIFAIVKEKCSHIEEIEKNKNYDAIEYILDAYNRETHSYVFELQNFISLAINMEENMSLLEKYQKIDEFLFKIKTTIMKTPETITDMKEDLLKIQRSIVVNLSAYDKKIPDEQKERLSNEIEKYHHMCQNKINAYFHWFIHDIIIEMKLILNTLCCFHQVWNKILKENTSATHHDMY